MGKAEWISIFTKSLLIGLPILLSVLFLRYRKNKTDGGQKNEIENDKARYVLRIPIFYRTVPIFVILLYCFIVIITLVQRESIKYIIGGGLLIGLPGMIMFTCWSLWKVEIRRDEFVYRNYIGVRKIYRYADLEYNIVKTGLKWYFYKNGKKVFCMPYYIEGGNKLEHIYKKYKSKHRNET